MKCEFPKRKNIHSIPDVICAAFGWLKNLDNPLWNFVRYMHRGHSFKESIRLAFY